MTLEAALAHVRTADSAILHLLSQPQFDFLLPCPWAGSWSYYFLPLPLGCCQRNCAGPGVSVVRSCYSTFAPNMMRLIKSAGDSTLVPVSPSLQFLRRINFWTLYHSLSHKAELTVWAGIASLPGTQPWLSCLLLHEVVFLTKTGMRTALLWQTAGSLRCLCPPCCVLYVWLCYLSVSVSFVFAYAVSTDVLKGCFFLCVKNSAVEYEPRHTPLLLKVILEAISDASVRPHK